MATLTLSSIRAFNIHPGTTAHITGKSHTYVTFFVNGVQETTSVFDSEASSHAVWKDTITLNLNSGASGELKVCRASSSLLNSAVHCVLLGRRYLALILGFPAVIGCKCCPIALPSAAVQRPAGCRTELPCCTMHVCTIITPPSLSVTHCVFCVRRCKHL